MAGLQPCIDIPFTGPAPRGMGPRVRTLALVALAGASLAACATTGPAPTPLARGGPAPRSGDHAEGAGRGTMRPYQVNGVWYAPHDQPDYDDVGTASWYGAQFHNRRTADGEVFDMDSPSAAHKTLPLPCIVEVTNLENGRKLRVRVNDRGPFVQGRIIDLSREAARQLGFYAKGTARVRVRYVGPADLARPENGLRYARAEAPPERRQPTAPPVAAPDTQSSPYSRAPQDAQATGADRYARNGFLDDIHDDARLSAGPADHPPPRVAMAGPPAQPPQPVLDPGAGRVVRIQAAAFSDRGNAERAAARLAVQGQTSVDVIQRGDSVLYRVTVRCTGGDEAVDRVAAAGFPGARLLDAF
ncbi:septal ring lytic transglycosylase RlpA family protein [Caulobacter sp. KR2-114]|uniref:septal ring lytic transglycosylase RlpA family protein n=1 Tax=Caulobacter sp. KR2-114 TaxID=3400912 RepID=UPI003C00B6DA